MTVAQLIAQLKEFDQDLTVVVNGYEGGFDNPHLHESEALLDANWDGKKKNEGWNGRHEWNHYDDNAKAVKVLVVGR